MKFHFIKTNRISVFEMLRGIDWGMVKKLLDGWKDGVEGYIEIKRKGRPKSREQLGYYYAVILPEAVQAFLKAKDFSLTVEHGGRKIELELTLDNMDSFLKVAYARATGIYANKSEMNMAECAAYEDWCIGWCAKWLNCQIPPSDANWKQSL